MMRQISKRLMVLAAVVGLVVSWGIYDYIDPVHRSKLVENPDCNYKTGKDHEFYGIKEVVVYYYHFPSREQQAESWYPESFKTEAFDKRFLEHLQKNLGTCLKLLSGGQKNISILRLKDGPYTEETAKSWDKIFDPKNLLIIVNLQLWQDRLIDGRYVKYGYINYFKHRQTAENYLKIPTVNSTENIDFLPHETSVEWTSKLDAIFSTLKPIGRKPLVGVTE